LFFTIYGVPLVFGGGVAAGIFGYFRSGMWWIFVHRRQVSAQLTQRLRIPYPLTGAMAFVVAAVGLCAWLTLTGVTYAILPTAPHDAPTLAFALALFYGALLAEAGIWVYAIWKPFAVSKRWGWGVLLGGALPVIIVSVILYALSNELFLVDVISVTALVMFSTLAFSWYGVAPTNARRAQDTLTAQS
jgi:hypothetical protein